MADSMSWERRKRSMSEPVSSLSDLWLLLELQKLYTVNREYFVFKIFCMIDQ